MKLLITGICGFVGSSLARSLLARFPGWKVWGMDNLARAGSEVNRPLLRALGVHVIHGDARCSSDFDPIPRVDWVIDAAANPSVLAGVDGRASSRQLIEHNLLGTLHTLEFSKASGAGFVLLSSSRVYSVQELCSIPLVQAARAFVLDASKPMAPGLCASGVREEFSTAPPVSLYGATKLASEVVALEYGAAFDFPVWVNRCGVLAGAGQFGTAEQGIFSYWIHAHRAAKPLRFTGFDGCGFQVRDALHPDDLAALVAVQLNSSGNAPRRVFNAGGGLTNATSLAQLAHWCDQRFGPHPVTPDSSPRPFDVPWLIMDSGRAQELFDWHPVRTLPGILEEIATHAEQNPDWLRITGA